jgi:riboflavin kinase/FMN adenylyltransferase
MRHYSSLQEVHLNDAWLSIGAFDGVHIGHRRILQELVASAHEDDTAAAVLTFYPHPSVVLRKRQDPFYLTSPEEKAELLGKLGVEVVITHPFDRIVSQLSAHDFLQSIRAHINFRHLWVGYDFAMGHNRTGDVHALESFAGKMGYELHVTSPVTYRGEIVSSSRIRSLLAEGEVIQVREMLSRPYRVAGTVIKGDGRGRSLGIPTANLDVWNERAIPAAGVYACHVAVADHDYSAVVNIGVRPTFSPDISAPRVEAHILDFDKDIYGEEIHLDFIANLRGEKRFPSPEALVAQIREDMQRARSILNTTGANSQ